MAEQYNILFVGDVHGNTKFMVDAIVLARRTDVDMIVQVGDFGFWPGKTGLAFLNHVQTILHNNDQYMIVVPGNHDDPERIAQNSHGIPSGDTRLSAVDRGATWEVEGVKIGFCGGAISVDRAGRIGYESWWPEEAITDDDVANVIAAGPVDLWVTHDSVEPPPSVASNHMRQFNALLQADLNVQRGRMRTMFDALQPNVYVHGHWHMRYSAPTEHGTVIGLGAESNDALALITLEEGQIYG